MRSAEDYRLDVAANDWWGEPLGTMLTRVLVEELSQRLPGTTVVDETGAITVDPDITVEINIGAWTRRGRARWSWPRRSRSPGGTRAARRSRAPSALRCRRQSPDLNGFVAAASVAVGRLADAIADMLRA